MQAILLNGKGEPRDVLTLGDIPAPPAPQEGHAVVRITKRAVHPADYLAIRGLLPAEAFVENGVPGLDGVGVVEAIGAGVEPSTGVLPGARVILYQGRRTWSERVMAPADALAPLPDDIDDATACQLGTNGVTAVMLLRLAEQAGSGADGDAPLLVTVAGSNVARNIIGLAGLQGRRVIGLVRRHADAAARAEHFSNVEVIGTDQEDWKARVRAAAKHPIQVAIDPIGGEMMPALLDLLAPGGTLITYGQMDPRPAAVSSGLLTSKALTIRGATAFGWVARTPRAQRDADYERLFALARQTPPLFAGYREFPLAQAAEAIAAAEQSPRLGATILVSGE